MTTGRFPRRRRAHRSRACKASDYGSDSGAIRAAEIKQIRTCFAQGRSGKLHQPAGVKSVVGRLIPLIAKRSRRKGRRLSGLEIRNRRVAPQSHVAIFGGNGDGSSDSAIYHEQWPRHGILGSSAVRRRGETRVTPCPCPLRTRIDLGVRQSFLVADKRPKRGTRRIEMSSPTWFSRKPHFRRRR